jgi:4-hydroxy-tetrahydrodipicolinate reductase
VEKRGAILIRLGISGISGKMGQRIAALAQQDKNLKITVALEAKGNESVGREIAGVKISDNDNEIKQCDCLIEFTTPQATLEHLIKAEQFGKAMVIGTTGIDEQSLNKIRQASKIIPIVFAPNMSVGVNVLFNLVKEASSKLNNYKVKIIEAHHAHKKDAPSGTAKKLAEIIGGNIPIESIREGEIVGDHRVIFESDVDRIELFHSAKTRDIFAQGALVAAKFVVNKKSGLFDMQDVLQN